MNAPKPDYVATLADVIESLRELAHAFHEMADGLGGSADGSLAGRGARSAAQITYGLSSRLEVHRVSVDAVRDVTGDPTWTPPEELPSGNCVGLHPFGPCAPGQGCNRPATSYPNDITSASVQGCCPHPEA